VFLSWSSNYYQENYIVRREILVARKKSTFWHGNTASSTLHTDSTKPYTFHLKEWTAKCQVLNFVSVQVNICFVRGYYCRKRGGHSLSKSVGWCVCVFLCAMDIWTYKHSFFICNHWILWYNTKKYKNDYIIYLLPTDLLEMWKVFKRVW